MGWRRVADWVVPGRTMGRQVARRTPLGHGVIRRRRVDMDRLDAFRDQLLREGEVRKLSASGEGCPLGTGDARGHGGCAVWATAASTCVSTSRGRWFWRCCWCCWCCWCCCWRLGRESSGSTRRETSCFAITAQGGELAFVRAADDTHDCLGLAWVGPLGGGVDRLGMLQDGA